jgi:hypothetical protein
MQGREPSPESPATFAFYCLVGFAGGFSERLATDLIERAGKLMSLSTADASAAPATRPVIVGTGSGTEPQAGTTAAARDGSSGV